jgi:hypothetical protein
MSVGLVERIPGNVVLTDPPITSGLTDEQIEQIVALSDRINGIIEVIPGTSSYRFISRSSTPGAYRLSTGVLSVLVPTTIVIAGTDCGDGTIGIALVELVSTVFRETLNGTALAGVRSWATSDAAGANIAGDYHLSDSNGLVTLMLPSGTYYRWRSDPQKRAQWVNPSVLVVS